MPKRLVSFLSLEGGRRLFLTVIILDFPKGGLERSVDQCYAESGGAYDRGEDVT
jgi:hypothetical protein